MILTIVESEFGGFSRRFSWVVVHVEAVVFDGLFGPWEESGRKQIVTLSEVVDVGKVEVLLVTLVVSTESETGSILSERFFKLKNSQFE